MLNLDDARDALDGARAPTADCERCERGAGRRTASAAVLLGYECTFCPACAGGVRARLPELRQLSSSRGRAGGAGAAWAARRHLYVHVPFCAHRCGYCDFVTVTGNEERHAAYIDALLAEFDSERALLASPLTTIFLGGGTPTLLGPALLDRLLAGLPRALELTVEANPETVDDTLAEVLVRHGARVSLGAQSFGARELAVLERRATPETVRSAVATLRRAGVANLSLDVLFGIPGETRAALDRDIDAALELEPEHLSCYELEAKPGTRFTFAHGAELARQAELLEDHYEHVIERLEGAGYRWYETANYCRDDRRCRHNLAIWRGEDYLGHRRRRGLDDRPAPTAQRSAPRALHRGARPGRAPIRVEEVLTADERLHERIMLGLRLDEPMAVAPVVPASTCPRSTGSPDSDSSSMAAVP